MEFFNRINFPKAEVEYSNDKIAVVIAQGWNDYYASSPFYWYMFIRHPMFHVMKYGQDNMSVSEIADNLRTNNYIGLLLCEASAPAFAQIDIQKMIVTDDIHRWFRNYSVGYYEAVRADVPILSCYSLASIPDEVPLSASRIARTMMIYCPHYVSDTPCYRAHIDRKPVGVCGGISDLTYPMRARMAERFSKFDPRPTRTGIRSDFIDILGDYRINITDDVRLGYMVAKYFEIPLAGSLLVAPEPHSEIEKFVLGFNESNSSLLNREKMYDDDYIERLVGNAIADRIGTEQRAFAGQALVRKRHTLEARVRYIWSIFQRMNSGTWSVRDQFDLFLASERNEDDLLDSRQIQEASAQETGCVEGNRVCLSVESGYNFREVMNAIGSKPAAVTVIAPTITQGERTVAQLAEELPTAKLSYVVRDRTIADRLSYRNDMVVVATRGGAKTANCIHELEQVWTHLPEIDFSHRQSVLEFWRSIEKHLKNRFGSSVVNMTIDENYDHVWGGISYWYWISRRDCARVRVERVMANAPMIGLLRQDGYAASVFENSKLLVEPILGDSQSTDHWQILFTAPEVSPLINSNDNVNLGNLEIRLSQCIAHMLSSAIDDVFSRHGRNAPM